MKCLLKKNQSHTSNDYVLIPNDRLFDIIVFRRLDVLLLKDLFFKQSFKILKGSSEAVNMRRRDDTTYEWTNDDLQNPTLTTSDLHI